VGRLFGTSEVLYFMVDTGLTGTLLTPEANEYLMPLPMQNTVEGLAGVGNLQAQLVFLDRIKLAGQIPVRPTLAAIVDFFQANMGRKRGIEIAGLVGMEFLEQYDLDIDPANERITIYDAQEPPVVAKDATVIQGCELPGSLIGAMLRGYKWPAEDAAEDAPRDPAPPILGIIDTGATYTIINWEAAKALGIYEDDPWLESAKKVNMMGVEGKKQNMPIIRMSMDICGFTEAPAPVPYGAEDEDEDSKGWLMSGMEVDESACIKFKEEAIVGIGNINFENLMRRQDEGPYKGPAAIIGQDLLMQKRYLISGSRRTLIFGADPPPVTTLEEAVNAGG
jgi:predicted aspartyl protease